VKRAIRWVKQNISQFGGDPQFIILSGIYIFILQHYD
jgi:carboxylesterase type B